MTSATSPLSNCLHRLLACWLAALHLALASRKVKRMKGLFRNGTCGIRFYATIGSFRAFALPCNQKGQEYALVLVQIPTPGNDWQTSMQFTDYANHGPLTYLQMRKVAVKHSIMHMVSAMKLSKIMLECLQALHKIIKCFIG